MPTVLAAPTATLAGIGIEGLHLATLPLIRTVVILAVPAKVMLALSGCAGG